MRVLKRKKMYKVVKKATKNRRGLNLMVEETEGGVGNDHIMGIGSSNDEVILDGSGGGSNVLDTGLLGAVDVVGEGEEGVGGDDDILELLHVSSTLLGSESSGDVIELGLPGSTLLTLANLVEDVEVNGVGLVSTLGLLLELKVQDLGVVAQPPVVGLVTSKTGAVDTGLLAGAETDDHSVLGVADRVRLGILEGDGGDNQIADGRLGQVLVLGDEVLEERGIDLDVVTLLLHGETIDLAGLDLLGLVIGVHLEDGVLAALLLLQELQSIGIIGGGNDTVRDLAGDDLGSDQVDSRGDGDPVTEGRHAVSTTGTGIGRGDGGKGELEVIDLVDLLLNIGQGDSNGSTGGGNVLEGGGGGEAEGVGELLDQGPGVEGIQEVNVAGGAGEDYYRKSIVESLVLRIENQTATRSNDRR